MRVLGAWMCLYGSPLHAASLSGRVLLGATGAIPVPQVSISIDGINPTHSDRRGSFVLSIPASSLPGSRKKLDIHKLGFCIYSPTNGEAIVPPDDARGPGLQVRLIPGETRSDSNQDCVAGAIAGVANRPKPVLDPRQQPEPVDMPRELPAWARRRRVQLTEAQARERLSLWLQDIKAEPNRGRYLRALALYAEGDYAAAKKLAL